MSGAQHGWFAAYLPHHGRVEFDQARVPGQLAQGSLLLEVTLTRGETGPLELFDLTAPGAGADRLALTLDREGLIRLEIRRGAAFHALSIDASADCAEGGPMRLSWRWDCIAGESLLTLEALERGTLRQRAAPAPVALARADLETLAEGRAPARIGPRVEWLAVGAHLHPAGPAACFAPSTPLLTPTGWRPAGNLRAGDLVETVDAGAQPVLWSGRIALPALGHLRPVRLCAPSFGASRDLWVLPQHRIALSGPTVDYLFGEDEVLVEARHLVDGCTALQPDRPNVLGWQGVLLDGHHLLIADGCRLESLNAGRLARQPALAATTALADLAALGALPEHRSPVRRVLEGFETRSLAAARSRSRSPVAA